MSTQSLSTRLRTPCMARKLTRRSKLFVSPALVVAAIPGVLLATGIRAENVDDKDDILEKRDLATFDGQVVRNVNRSFVDGQFIFRFDTLGDEAFWGDALRLHQAVQGERFGGVGPGLTPRAALMPGTQD